jgi:hypothetical protein
MKMSKIEWELDKLRSLSIFSDDVSEAIKTACYAMQLIRSYSNVNGKDADSKEALSMLINSMDLFASTEINK